MKHKKKIERLKEKQKAYDAMITKFPLLRHSHRRPGSVRKA